MKYAQWDWKEQPDWNRINEILDGIQYPQIIEVDSKSDSYVIVVAPIR